MKKPIIPLWCAYSLFMLLLALGCDSALQEPPATPSTPRAELLTPAPGNAQTLQPCDPAGKLAFPSGTTFTESQGTLQYQLPEGFQPVFFREEERLYLPPGGTIKCTCQMDGGGGCWPGKAGDYVGCYTEANNPCTKGLMEVTTGSITLQADEVDIHIGNQEEVEKLYGSLAVLVMMLDVRPQFSFSEMHRMPAATEALLSEPEVAEDLEEMLEAVNPAGVSVALGEALPPGYALSPVRVKGHLAYLVVSEETARAEHLPLLPLTTDQPYCTGCNNQCKAESMYLERVWYCTGCTSGCTLHF